MTTSAITQKRSGSMLCYPFEEKRLEKWGFPVFVQPKLDGDRIRARRGYDVKLPLHCYHDETFLLSSSLNLRNFAVPHIVGAYNELCNETKLAIPLDGEGYIHGWDHEDIHGLFSRTTNRHPHYERGELHVFDLAYTDLPQWERFKILFNLELKPPLKRVETFIVNDYKELWFYYEKFVDEEYEGIIVRHPDAPYLHRRSTFVMKFKPKKDDWYKIVDVKEAISVDGKPLKRLGSLVCCGDDGETFDVGTGIGITLEDCYRLWKIRDYIPGCRCHVKYQHLSSKGRIPRFAKFVEITSFIEKDEAIDPFALIG